MGKFLTFAYALLALAGSASASPTASHKVNDGDFTLLQLFTDDKERFFREWAQPTPPNLTTTSVTVRSKPVFMALVVAGCAVDPASNCDVTGDILIIDPTGKIYGQYKDLPVLRRSAGDTRLLMLSPVMLDMTVEKGESLGAYRFAVTITDNISRKTLKIENVVTVGEAPQVAD